MAHDVALKVPDIDLLWETAARHEIGKRMYRADDEHVLAARGDVHAFEDRRLADCGAGAGHHIDQGELRSEVVVEQLLVEVVFQEVFEGRRRGGAAAGFLNRRTHWGLWLDGRGSAAVWHEFSQQGRAGGPPPTKGAVSPVWRGPREGAGRVASGVGDAQD